MSRKITFKQRNCLGVCVRVLFPVAHISVSDMMSMWREQGSTELSHYLQGGSVMIKGTLEGATKALPKQPSTHSHSHLLYYSLTWSHKFSRWPPWAHSADEHQGVKVIIDYRDWWKKYVILQPNRDRYSLVQYIIHFCFVLLSFTCSILFDSFDHPVASLCYNAVTHSVLYFTLTQCLPSFTAFPPMTPSWLWCPQLRPKAWSIAGRHEDSSCAWHMFTANSSLCFISSSSLFISLFLCQSTLFFLLWPLPLHSEQVIPPEGQFYTLHLLSIMYPCSCSLNLYLKPCCEWQPETYVPRAGRTNWGGRLEERSKLSERQWEEAKSQLWRITLCKSQLFITYLSNWGWHHCTACYKVWKLYCISNNWIYRLILNSTANA